MELIRLDFSNFQDYKEAKEILKKVSDFHFWKNSQICSILLEEQAFNEIIEYVMESEEWEEKEEQEHKKELQEHIYLVNYLYHTLICTYNYI